MAAPQVPTVTLNDGITMPQLGFGVFKIDDDGAQEAVSVALDAGYRLVDTAKVYGNEAGVGRALAESGVERDELFVTTKLWNDDHGFDATLAAFDESMENLGLETLDLYLIHWPCPAKDLYVDTWKALLRLKQEGRVRSVGVSNFEPEHLERLVVETDTAPSVNQVELHPHFQQHLVRKANAEHHVITEAWGPIGQGKGLLEEADIVAVAEAHEVSPAQAVLRWHLDMGNVVIPKSQTPARIRDNIDVFSFELTDDERAAIDALERNQRNGLDPREFNG